MVKKLKEMAEEQAASAAGRFDSALAGSVRQSAQQIWLAGLGAFSKAQAEGGKVFESLVKDGLSMQRKTQSAAEEKLGEVASKMSSVAGEVQAKAGQQWGKLETIFEERVAKAMGKLGVPTAIDVDALSQRIDALSAKVAKLTPKPAAVKRVAAKSALAKSAAPPKSALKAVAKAPAGKRAAAGKAA